MQSDVWHEPHALKSLQQNQSGMPLHEKHLVEALFIHASIGILVADRQGTIILSNPFLDAQFGYFSQELSGKKVEVLIPSRFQGKHVQHREMFTSHMQNRPMGAGMDLFGIRKDGTEFPVEVSLCHYSNNEEEEKLVIAFINNISIRKKAEEEIKKLNDELEEKVSRRTQELKDALHKLEVSREELAKALNKEKELNELKSRFVSLASHEFRTPLSTVLSSAYLLKQYTTTEDQIKRGKHIERIVSSVDTLTAILNDFLSVGKIEEGKIQLKLVAFDIRDLVTTIVDELKHIRRSGQHISYVHEGGNEIVLDPVLLKHIVLNLLSNAIKFSPEQSLIEVKTELSINGLLLVVRDNGIGISEEDQKHLFERFFRGTNAVNIEGTGLGLHIVSKYTEMMRGTIACDSSTEKGTAITLQFQFDCLENGKE